jgi:hypothetical protein
MVDSGNHLALTFAAESYIHPLPRRAVMARFFMLKNIFEVLEIGQTSSKRGKPAS